MRRNEGLCYENTVESHQDMDDADKRGQLIKLLEDASLLADDLKDGTTGYLIKRAIDSVRADRFSNFRSVEAPHTGGHIREPRAEAVKPVLARRRQTGAELTHRFKQSEANAPGPIQTMSREGSRRPAQRRQHRAAGDTHPAS
jgi:hypothetical protein